LQPVPAATSGAVGFTNCSGKAVSIVEYVDSRRELYRAAVFAGERLELCLFLGPADAPPQWDTVKTLFATDIVDAVQRRYLLSGRQADCRKRDPSFALASVWGFSSSAPQ